jgi:TatD DNase family protein
VWIDTHAHLTKDVFRDDLPELLERARDAGVEAIVVVGYDLESSRAAIDLAERYPGLAAAVGIQPNDLLDAGPDDFDRIAELARHPAVTAIGETGLDLYWKTVPLEYQRESLRRHLTLARQLGLPTIIHSRSAEAESVEELVAESTRAGASVAAVLHSYTGPLEPAQRLIEAGGHVSFAGMVSFKRNEDLRTLAASLPPDRLMVETDAPYLSPEPFRHLKRNEPARVIHTGAALAGALGLPAEEFARLSSAAARRLFPRLRFFEGGF